MLVWGRVAREVRGRTGPRPLAWPEVPGLWLVTGREPGCGSREDEEKSSAGSSGSMALQRYDTD